MGGKVEKEAMRREDRVGVAGRVEEEVPIGEVEMWDQVVEIVRDGGAPGETVGIVAGRGAGVGDETLDLEIGVEGEDEVRSGGRMRGEPDTRWKER